MAKSTTGHPFSTYYDMADTEGRRRNLLVAVEAKLRLEEGGGDQTARPGHLGGGLYGTEHGKRE